MGHGRYFINPPPPIWGYSKGNWGLTWTDCTSTSIQSDAWPGNEPKIWLDLRLELLDSFFILCARSMLIALLEFCHNVPLVWFIGSQGLHATGWWGDLRRRAQTTSKWRVNSSFFLSLHHQLILKRSSRSVVEFASYSDLKTAIEKLDGTDLNGRRIRLVEDKDVRRGSRRRSRSRSSSRSRSRSRSRRRSRSRSRLYNDQILIETWIIICFVYFRSRSKSRSRSKRYISWFLKKFKT